MAKFIDALRLLW